MEACKEQTEKKKKTKKQERAKWEGGNHGPDTRERRSRKNGGQVGAVGSGGQYAVQRFQDPKPRNGGESGMDSKGEILPGGRG